MRIATARGGRWSAPVELGAGPISQLALDLAGNGAGVGGGGGHEARAPPPAAGGGGGGARDGGGRTFSKTQNGDEVRWLVFDDRGIYKPGV